MICTSKIVLSRVHLHSEKKGALQNPPKRFCKSPFFSEHQMMYSVLFTKNRIFEKTNWNCLLTILVLTWLETSDLTWKRSWLDLRTPLTWLDLVWFEYTCDLTWLDLICSIHDLTWLVIEKPLTCPSLVLNIMRSAFRIPPICY